MKDFDLPSGGLPVPLSAPAPRTMPRAAPKAAFLSQLIAERHHLATQRTRRQAPVVEALDRYGAGERMTVRRIPPGYRMRLDA
jgi:hypothetical protein